LEVGSRNGEVGKQRTEDGGQRIEDPSSPDGFAAARRSQRTEDRIRSSDNIRFKIQKRKLN